MSFTPRINPSRLDMMFTVLVLLVASASGFAPLIVRDPKAVRAHAVRDHVNSLGTTWKAGDGSKSRKNLMNVKYTKHPEGVEYLAEAQSDNAIPESFDARTKWPACKSIGFIRDQSQCGSCWAVAAAEAFTDRVCIGSNGKLTPELAAEDPLSCCDYGFCGEGCEGGFPIRAWQWAMSDGFCTGSGFYEATGCKPYSIEPCDAHVVNGIMHYHDCTNFHPTTPRCKTTCTNSNYNVDYKSDKHFAKSVYAVKQSVSAIQTEIMNNGPVEASFTVYEDFNNYDSGIYQHVTGKVTGGHAVKILGWGTDNGTPYWLIANSWNNDWGENGFFRMIRGKNECGIEEAIVAGLAKV